MAEDKLFANEHADQYNGLFQMMMQEHDVMLTVEEMDEIIFESLKVEVNLKTFYAKNK